ncbi:MAG: hypothetical protein DRI83_12570, partial [Bacteroidetes bacterium]
AILLPFPVFATFLKNHFFALNSLLIGHFIFDMGDPFGENRKLVRGTGFEGRGMGFEVWGKIKRGTK